jgi:hypothetical protein
VFLEGMTDTGDISVDLVAIGQTNTGNFPQCRVGLLGRCGKNTQAHSPPLRALGQIWRTASRLLGLTTLAYQLLNCRHATSASCFARRDPAASFTISFRAFGLLAFLPFCLFAFLPFFLRLVAPPAGFRVQNIQGGPQTNSRDKNPPCPRLGYEGSGEGRWKFPICPLHNRTIRLVQTTKIAGNN